MSAPAAKARALPVTIMQRTSLPRSQASSASASSLSQIGAQRIQRIGPVQGGDADRISSRRY